MARLASIGFELQTITSGVEGGDRSQAGAMSISTSITRSTGIASLRMNPTASQYEWDTILPAKATLFGRTYIYINSMPTTANNYIFGFYKNSSGAGPFVVLTSSGTLQLWNSSSGASASQIGSSSSALSTGTWYRLEIKADVSTNPWSLEMLLDGSSIASGTVAATATTMDTVTLDCEGITPSTITASNTTGDMYFDDVAVNDNTGSFQNTYPGAGGIVHLQPNAAGDNNQFTVQIGGTAGSTNNYTRVDEITPDNATTYNGDIVSGNTDDFNLTDTPTTIGSLDTINVVAVGVRYRAVVASLEATFKARVKKISGGTVSSSAGIQPISTTWVTNANATPRTYPIILYQDPDSSNWTKSTLDSSQIGYTISTASTNAADISTVWMLIDFTPSVSTAISVSDTVNTLESIDTVRNSSRDLLASDTISTSESITVSANANPNISDTVSTTENIKLLDEGNRSVSDSTSISENIQLLNIDNIIVSDSINTSETIGVDIVVPGTSLVSSTDNTTLAEGIKLLVSNFINVSDSTSISEVISFTDVDVEGVSDTVATSEQIKLLVDEDPRVSDILNTSEAITPFILTLLMTVSDTTVTSEIIKLLLNVFFVAVSDTILTSESVAFFIPTLTISASNTINTTESVVVIVPSPNNDTVVSTDTVTISEGISLKIPTLIISVSNSVTTSESILLSRNVTLGISVIDISVTSEAISLIAGRIIARTSVFTMVVPSSINFTITKSN